jgi:hypothetical protein
LRPFAMRSATYKDDLSQVAGPICNPDSVKGSEGVHSTHQAAMRLNENYLGVFLQPTVFSTPETLRQIGIDHGEFVVVIG